MFDFANAENVIVALPWKIYWSIAGGVTALLLIGQLFLTFPEWTTRTVDLLGWKCLRDSRLYAEAMKRKREMDKLKKERSSVVRRGTGDSDLSGKSQGTTIQNSRERSATETVRLEQETGTRPNGQLRWMLSPFRRRRELSPNREGEV